MGVKSKLINIRIKYASSPANRAKLVNKYLDITLGKNCEIFDQVSFGSEPYLIEIGDNVRITKGVNFITHDGGTWVLRNLGIAKDADIFGRIKVGSNVHIGINAVIMPGVVIGDNVIIAVGAIVTKDVPSNTIVAGVPAKIIRTVDEYFSKNKSAIDYTKHMPQLEKKAYLIEKYSLVESKFRGAEK